MKRVLLSILMVMSFLFSQSLTDSLKAYYPFSGNADDASGYGNHAVNYGAVLANDRYEIENSAYSFNGSSDYMMIGNPVPEVLQIQNEITLSAWIYLTSYPGSSNLGLIVGSQTDYTFSGATIHIDGRTNSDGQPCPAGHIHFQIGDGTGWHTSNAQTQVPLNQWVLITATRKANEDAKIYYNNVLQPLTSVSWNGNITYNSAWMMIGRQQDYSNRYFNGTIDEVRVYSRALEQQDVDQLYANYLPPANLAGSAEEGRNVLSWDTSGYADLVKIRIFRDGSFYDEITVDGPEDSLYYDNGVTPGIIYGYSISSVDIYDNESIKTDPVNVTAIEITFTDINAGLTGVSRASLAWGDYDNDGDQDLLLTGGSPISGPISKIYRNDSGTFTDINAGLPGVLLGSVAWGDYDNDGDLDILLTGDTGSGFISKIYRNDTGIFIDINSGLPAVCWCSVAWGDYDNDGDLDILLTGHTGSINISNIYRNDSGIFNDINAGLTEGLGSVAWGDYDNDGDLDILLCSVSGSSYALKIYRNDAGIFTEINTGFIGTYAGSVAWGDYDCDGDLDILLTGYTGSEYISKIYRNDVGTFTDISADIINVCQSAAVWGDYDNDGDLDILLTGNNGANYVTIIYRNEYGIFIDIGAELTAAADYSSNLAWVDYDNDGDLDLCIAGGTWEGEYISKIYRNNCVTPNMIPNSPANLEFVQDENGMQFSFDPATDNETPASGLTYNIDINIGDGTVKAASSDLATGNRRLSNMGNIQQNTSWTLVKEAPPETIPQQLFEMIWKVQAVDNCFAGSAFSSKIDTVMTRSLITVPKEIMSASDALTWEYYTPADSIAGYTLQLSGDSLFTDCFETFMSTAKENKTVYIGIDLLSLGVTDSLVNNGKYFWRVKPEHVNFVENPTGFRKVPDSFIYDPIYSAPSPVSISVDGNYVTLQWGSGKEAEKGEVYNVYSTDDPHAVFPEGWTLMISDLNATEWTVKSTVQKKFYCVTASGSAK